MGRQESFSWEALVASAIGLPRNRNDLMSLAVNFAMTGEVGIGPGRGSDASHGGNGPGLKLSPDAIDNWGPQYASGGSSLGPDYSLVAGGVRFGGDIASEYTGGQDFRQSERDYRSITEDSVAGASYRARSGDGIARIVGSSHPQAVGNFMRANGLMSDRIEAGRNYFVPDSSTAYGESTALGQFALNQGNRRIAVLAARAQAASNAMTWGNNLSFDGDGSSFSAMSANTASIFEDNLSVRVGLGGRVEANFAFAGAGAQQVPMAAPDAATSNFFGYTKAELLGATQSAAVWGVRQGGAVGAATLWGSSTAGALIDVMYPGSLTEASLGAAGGAVISKAAPAAIGYLNTLPVLGAEVGPGLRAIGRWVGTGVDDAAIRFQDNMGLVLRAVPDSTPVRLGNVEVGAGSAASTLSRIEGRFANASREVGFVVDSESGTILTMARQPYGQARASFRFSDKQWAMAEGNWITHNHPSGNTLGVEDLAGAVAIGARGIRASTKSGVYELTFDGSFASAYRGEKLGAAGFLGAETNKIGAGIMADVRSGTLVVPAGLTGSARNGFLANEMWIRYANHTPGLQYTFTPWRHKCFQRH